MKRKKKNIRKHLYTINKAGRTLLETKDALYLLDHTDKEGLDNRDTRDGFGAILKADKAGLTAEDIQDIKNDIDNGIIRNQEDVNRWAEKHLDKQRYNDSDSIDAEDRRSNGNNDSLDYSTLQGESRREQSNQDSQGNRRESTIKTGYDGTNGPRYIDIERFTTPQGEIYGFVTKEDKVYLDGKIMTAEHPAHEFTHVWDRVVTKNNPELWHRGVTLMRQIPLWQEIENDANYGAYWKSKNITGERLENLIASEVHSRLVGRKGKEVLDKLAKEQGSNKIINKLKQWLLDFWKEVKATFSSWSNEDLDKLTLDDFVNMTLRDLVDDRSF